VTKVVRTASTDGSVTAVDTQHALEADVIALLDRI
jgi:hypothetical protein